MEIVHSQLRVVLIAFTNIEYTIELAEALTKLIDVILMIPEKQMQRFKDVMSSNLRIIPFKQPRLRQIANIYFVYNMLRLINELKPSLIHIQRGHPWFNFVLPLLKRYPLITTIHDVILHSGDKESSKIPQFTHNIAIKYAKQIIVHGEVLKNEMIREYKKLPDEINVIQRGINSIYIRYIDHIVTEEKDSILFFGRICDYKGLRYLIEAEPLITKEIPNVKIIIAGRGGNFQDYEKNMINKEKYVVYNQHISNRMVAELFQKASVVVLPYTDASQSGVVPLAYAFKKPVVVTNVGSLPEVVDHDLTGYIVPPRDSKELARAVVALLRDKGKCQRMGENAYIKAQGDLSWDRIASKTLQVYQKVFA